MRRADNLTTFMCRFSWNLGASSGPVMGLLFLKMKLEGSGVYKTPADSAELGTLKNLQISAIYERQMTIHFTTLFGFPISITFRNSVSMYISLGRSRWPYCLRSGSAAAFLLGLRVRIRLGMNVILLCLLCR